jgi:hypothetical protein
MLFCSDLLVAFLLLLCVYLWRQKASVTIVWSTGKKQVQSMWMRIACHTSCPESSEQSVICMNHDRDQFFSMTRLSRYNWTETWTQYNIHTKSDWEKSLFFLKYDLGKRSGKVRRFHAIIIIRFVESLQKAKCVDWEISLSDCERIALFRGIQARIGLSEPLSVYYAAYNPFMSLVGCEIDE